MSATQFYVNETEHTQFVGGRMIPPGEGRDVPLMYLPATHRPEPVAVVVQASPSLDVLLADLLTLSVKNIVLQLPELTHEALDRLEALEREMPAPHVTRKTLIEAIGVERLKRAADTFQAEMDEQTATHLAALSPEERAAIESMVPGNAPTTAQSLLPAAAVAGAQADALADGAQPQPEQV